MQVRALCLKLSWIAAFEISAFFMCHFVRRLAVAKKSSERFEATNRKNRRPTNTTSQTTLGHAAEPHAGVPALRRAHA